MGLVEKLGNSVWGGEGKTLCIIHTQASPIDVHLNVLEFVICVNRIFFVEYQV
jgi:hypothetical protein